HHQPLRRGRLRRRADDGYRYAARCAAVTDARHAACRRRPKRVRLGMGHPRGSREPVDEATALFGPPLGGNIGVKRTRNILANRNLPVLSTFAASNVLLAFDYDGTLAPIAAAPRLARMRARTHQLLVRVTRVYP